MSVHGRVRAQQRQKSTFIVKARVRRHSRNPSGGLADGRIVTKRFLHLHYDTKSRLNYSCHEWKELA